MEKNLLLRKGIYSFVILLLVFPLAYISTYISWQPLVVDDAFWVTVGGAFLQSLISTLGSLIAGFVGALGLLRLKESLRPSLFKVLKITLIIPSVAPPLIIILIGSHVLGYLPLGLWGIIFFHCLMNIGLVSVLLFYSIYRKSGYWLKASLICGVSNFQFVVRGLLPGLVPEFKNIFFYLMVLYFFSFSIPLMVGGAVYGGIEVFIFEKVVLLGEWAEAIQYSVGLFLLLLLVSFVLKESPKTYVQNWEPELSPFKFFGSSSCVIVGAVPSLLLFVGFVQILVSKLSHFNLSDIGTPLLGTLIVSLLTGFFVFVILSLLAFCFLNQNWSRFIVAMVNPGWVIVGFSFLLMPGDSDGAVLAKIAMALNLLFLPFLFRLSFNQQLKALEAQVRLAELMPVSWQKIFFSIIWPQCLPGICLLSGLASLWAAGDFALSSIVVGSSQLSTLALDMKLLILSYRLEQAMTLLLPLLVVSLVVFFIFQGLAYVSRRKILS